MEEFAIQIAKDSGMNLLVTKILVMIVFGSIVMGFVSLMAGLLSWAERRIAGRIQSRIGPNRVGPQGLLQFVADGAKCLQKEDIIPEGVDRPLFRLAPYLCFMGVFATFAVLPWGGGLIVSDLNVGILYLISITSLVVIGILMAGCSSNNKWSLLGGCDPLAQIVSYEIPVAMSLLAPILFAGGLSMSGFINVQGWAPWEWTVFHSPFMLVSCLVFFIGSLAEGNRTPFDIPEAESELVSGYNTEYSGFRFLFFFFAEWANLYVIGAIITAVYLGGGKLPGVLNENVPLGVLTFMAKTFFIVFVIILLRWTLPRFRVDQLMKLTWKVLVPLSLIVLFGEALYMIMERSFPIIDTFMPFVLFLLFAALIVYFIMRVAVNYKEVRLLSKARR